ncbi:hypothetical protein CHS0354_031880 [Potamilus streckersoni]|uniref:Uncharacterized protein n=1 Tax=Potamilus streckersoni TaxID=2493646 RepID=A0AAE0RXW3_9BIVA|nr:hypothetical protein CHS0354_031880 [Potamilus streckersoni]
MISPGIWFMSFIVYGLLIQDSKGQEDAEHSISSWNQNQHRHRPTNEPRLQAFDQLNTRDDSEELEPVTNPRGVVINKVVPGQEMHRDVLNSGYLVFDGKTVSRKHMPMKQTQKWTTIEPRQGMFDRKHTTDVHEESESVTNIQPQNQITREPQQDKFYRIITTDDSEEFEPVTKALPENPIRIEPQQEVFDRTITTDGSEEFEPVTSNQPQNPTTTEPRLGVFDRMNTTDDSDEVETVTNIESQNTKKAPLRVLDRTHATDDSVTDYNGTVFNKPVHRQDMYSDIIAQGRGNLFFISYTNSTYTSKKQKDEY